MKTITLLTICTFFFSFSFCQSLAPEVISSAGDFFQPNVNGPSISWTLGETVTETFTDAGNNNILTQGFQQSRYDIVVVENIEENLNITLYPNPTSQFLNIDWEIPGNSGVSIELIDIHGRTLINKSFLDSKSQKQLDISSYPAADYFVRILSGNKSVKTYKVSKY